MLPRQVIDEDSGKSLAPGEFILDGQVVTHKERIKHHGIQEIRERMAKMKPRVIRTNKKD